MCSSLFYPKISVCLLVVAASLFCLVLLLLLLFWGSIWYISISFLWIMLLKDCSLLYLLLSCHKKKQYLSQTAFLPRRQGKARGGYQWSQYLLTSKGWTMLVLLHVYTYRKYVCVTLVSLMIPISFTLPFSCSVSILTIFKQQLFLKIILFYKANIDL